MTTTQTAAAPSATQAPEGDTRRILLVDDEPAILQGLQRRHRKHFDLTTATGPEEGLTAIREQGPFAVIVTDFKMPGMNGTEFLAHAREIDPAAIPLMLTGQADLDTAIDAVNRGHIFRFLSKPCDPELFRSSIQAALEQYDLRDAERQILEQTVTGSVEMLAEVLSLSQPAAFGRSTRLHQLVTHACRETGTGDTWRLKTAALLSQIGLVSIPNDLVEKDHAGTELSEYEARMMEGHAEIAANLLAKIPRLQEVAEVVRFHQREEMSETTSAVARDAARLRSAALFERLLLRGNDGRQAVRVILDADSGHDADFVEALRGAGLDQVESQTRSLALSQIRIGMKLEADVKSTNGGLLIGRGHVISEGSLRRLQNYADLDQLANKVFEVRLPDPESGS